ncbi:hypothetical protein ER308_07245 [Egibacter rhizosphaerae]|uniref:Uncharacterized protein n=1 Tax=Egibacter rhizosphaerae TaxID=1670831 RepID=A0A411YDV9_9ACTN|nr:hypothetical protein [Egibacter rhizosphaerae]QBI19360.1 hypothetical protein ER308_07245 [Egibacter rhizosphaerae]
MSERLNCRRNRVAWKLANLALHLGTPRYRMLIGQAVRRGLVLQRRETEEILENLEEMRAGIAATQREGGRR